MLLYKINKHQVCLFKMFFKCINVTNYTAAIVNLLQNVTKLKSNKNREQSTEMQ